ncbi:NADPH-dependent FMN reductase [Vibrio sonorensis]|uniref:NADPH-dependent FMN reductase n=1 Tax=Vibrio sonorensis TaxID=1004316 RepID=UPI0008D9419F|nr:NADPH-dependent FMN reductase [Vibrio sonorensis]
MKVIAFGASTSSTSINKTLATYAANLLPNAEIKVLDIKDYSVPLFSEDTEKEIGKAEGAEAFLRDIEQADALIISFAEHNGSYPAAYKNLFDWATRINREVYQNKPAVYLSTSPGPGGAKTVLAQATTSAPYFGGDVKASVSVPSFYDTFDLDNGRLTNAEIEEQVKQAVSLLA